MTNTTQPITPDVIKSNQPADHPWHEEKYLARRREISRAAITLAERAQSIDNVSIDDIAKEAGISRRTFFNYVPSKMAALLMPYFIARSTYMGIALSQPENVSALDAVRAGIEGAIERTEDFDLAARSERILDRYVHAAGSGGEIPNAEATRSHIDALERNLATRQGGESPIERSLIMSLGDQILRLALRSQLSSDTTPPADVVNKGFAFLSR
ncbi:TetR/AcrR family transcriptional regulator [Arcanobacterium canis]